MSKQKDLEEYFKSLGIREAPPDSPLYKRGPMVVFGRRLTKQERMFPRRRLRRREEEERDFHGEDHGYRFTEPADIPNDDDDD